MADVSDEELTPLIRDTRYGKRDVYRDLACLTTVFVLFGLSWTALQNLESSLNYSGGLGLSSLATIFGAIIISCIYAPAVVKLIGEKGGIILGVIGQVVFTAANFYPHAALLIPASAIVGLCFGPLLTAHGKYITTIAIAGAKILNEKPDVIISRFNGIYFSMYQLAHLSGNLASSLILKPKDNDTSTNSSVGDPSLCGINFCHSEIDNTGVARKPEHHLVMIMIGVFLAFVLAALIFAVFALRPINRYKTEDTLASKARIVAGLQNFVSIMRDPKLILCVPLYIYSGVERSFMAGDFTEAFVTCNIGIHWVGISVISYCLVNTISCLTNGPLTKYVGRFPLITVAVAFNTGVLVFFFEYFGKYSGHKATYIIVPAFWGFADGVWQTQTSAFTGLLFSTQTEAAFAQWRMWQSVGAMVYFFLSPRYCMYGKAVGVGIGLALTFVTCSILQIYIWQKGRPKLSEANVSLNKKSGDNYEEK